MIYRWQISIWKDAWLYMSLGNCKLKQQWDTIAHLFSSVQSLSLVRPFTTPWTAARQASLSFTISQSWSSWPSNQWCHPTIASSDISFSSCLQSFPLSGSLLMSQPFASGGQNIEASVSPSVLLLNSQDWFPLGLTGWISLHSKGLSRVSSNTTSALSFLYSPALTPIHDYWKNHSFDWTDLCWQSNISTF